MNSPRSLSGTGQDAQVAKSNVIKFNMRDEETMRGIARRGYEIKKRLNDLGIKVKKIIPASTEPTVRKQFRLPPDTDLVCVELNINQKTDDEKDLLVSEVKDQLLMLDGSRLIDEGDFSYDISSKVHRLLIKFDEKIAARE